MEEHSLLSGGIRRVNIYQKKRDILNSCCESLTKSKGKISAQVPTSLCIRSFVSENNSGNNRFFWECGALFFLLRGFFSKWTLKKPVELLTEIRKIEHFFLPISALFLQFYPFFNIRISARSGVSSNRCNRV